MKSVLSYVSIFVVLVKALNGYLIYCPCMGRFGNQVDQFLGSLRFAKSINRTMVVPPWIEYVDYIDLNFRPFESLFQLEVVQRYHSVISMRDFMKNVAPVIWPKGSRKVFCYGYRDKERIDCAAKDGRPFKNFWDHFGIDFDDSIIHKPLTAKSSASDWISRFPKEKVPVLAFVSAPGFFPIEYEDTQLHKFLAWTQPINNAVEDIIREKLQRPFVAIHLRNDYDFESACRLLTNGGGMKSLFDSAQCHGYDPKAKLPIEQCYPSNELIVAHVRDVMNKVNARALYVATDREDFSSLFGKSLGANLQSFYSSKQMNAPIEYDLALLGRADGAVLNCVSSFSAFARRERDTRGLTTDYFGFTALSKTEL